MSNLLTIGIPAYNAKDYICDCLASIQIQTIKNDVEIIIASDNPDEDYGYLEQKFSDLRITTLNSEKNIGLGLTRQRCIDNANSKWITFIDPDDVFFSPLSLEMLLSGVSSNNTIEVQGPFLRELDNNEGRTLQIRNEISHPWVFGRLYNVDFLKHFGIEFTLRVMEDSCFNNKIRMLIEGTDYRIDTIDTYPIYFQRSINKKSMTRINTATDGLQQYEYDLGDLGQTIASIEAVNFCREKNPANHCIDRIVVEMFVCRYFKYIECIDKNPIFADQVFYNAKKFYHECYKSIEESVPYQVLMEEFYRYQTQYKEYLFGVIPKITFFDFLEEVKTSQYNGDIELKEIRAKLPKDIVQNDIFIGGSEF